MQFGRWLAASERIDRLRHPPRRDVTPVQTVSGGPPIRKVARAEEPVPHWRVNGLGAVVPVMKAGVATNLRNL